MLRQVVELRHAIKPNIFFAANDIRDIKPPIEIPNGWEWLWWTLGALVVLVI